MAEFVIILPENNDEDDINRYLEHRWKDLQWKNILSLVNINLSILYDSPINYWSADQVTDMYAIITQLYYEPEKVVNDTSSLPYIKQIRDQIYRLMKDFESFAAQGARISVF